MGNYFSWIYCEESNNRFVLVRSHYRVKNGKLELVHALHIVQVCEVRLDEASARLHIALFKSHGSIHSV